MLATPSAFAIAWDITDQDCDAFDLDWVAGVAGGGTATAVTEDGRSCYKLYNPGVDGGDEAYAYNTSVSWDSDCTIEIVFKIDDDIDDAVWDFSIYTRDDNEYYSSIRFNYNTTDFSFPYAAIRSYSDSAYVTIRSFVDISTATWHTLRMIVDSDYVTAWVDGFLIDAGWGPSDTATGGSVSTIGMQSISSSTSVGRTIYIDSVKMSSSVEVPAVVTPWKIEGQDIVTRIYQDAEVAGWVSQSAMRFEKPNCTFQDKIIHQIPIVVTTDDNASAIRIYDGAATKALMKLPT